MHTRKIDLIYLLLFTRARMHACKYFSLLSALHVGVA